MAEGDDWAAMRAALGRAYRSATALEGYLMSAPARILVRHLKRALVDATLEAPLPAGMTSVLWTVDAAEADAVALEMLQTQAGSAKAGAGFAEQIMRAADGAEDQPEALDGEETDGQANSIALAADADDEASSGTGLSLRLRSLRLRSCRALQAGPRPPPRPAPRLPHHGLA